MNRLIKNPLEEWIPEFMVANSNHTFKGSWARNHCPAPLGCSKGNTTAVGRATIEDIRTGWCGHLTTREMQDQWSRFSGAPVGNHMDNHRNGTSCASYEAVRWGALWISRSLGGWTPAHFLESEWLYREHDNIYDGFNTLGAPHWWTLSEFV